MMKYISSYKLFLPAAFALLSCSSPHYARHPNPPSLGNVRGWTTATQHSLDWAGEYTGNLRTANGGWLRVTIRLKNDRTYLIQYWEVERLQRSNTKPIEHHGKYHWYEPDNKILLLDLGRSSIPSSYLVGKQTLIPLDQKGDTITNPLTQKNELRKTFSDITEIYWKLIELLGTPVNTDPKTSHDQYIILKSADNSISGFAGCNLFGGDHKLQPRDYISFSEINSTVMDCQHLPVEKLFFYSLEAAERYTISKDTLSLYNTLHAPLARFVAVYLK